MVPEPVRSPVVPAVEHRPDRKRDRRDVHRRRAHQAAGHRLVAADGEHDAVERIAVKDLDEAQVSEIAVEAGRGTLAGFLDRMDRKFERDAAGRVNPLLHMLGEDQMMPIARHQIAPGLGDADDRLARLKLLQRNSVVGVALQVERRHVDVIGIVEPGSRAELALGRIAHWPRSGRRCGNAGDGQPVDHAVVVRLARVHPRRSERRLVGRVGKDLRLERDPVAHAVDVLLLADQRAVEEVAGVDLDSRLVGQHLEHAARARVLEPRGELGLGRLAGIEHEIVVDPAADDDLRVAPVAHDLVENSPAGEIEWRARDGPQLSRRDERGVDRRVAVRGDGQAVGQRSARRAFAGEVEQSMIGQVDDRRRVGARVEIDGQRAAVVQRVGRRHRELAGIALVARRAHQPKRDLGETALVAHVDDLPDALVEPDRAAVQRVGLVVERQLVGFAVEGEAAAGDAIGVAADRLAPIIRMLDVAARIVIAERHVGDVPGPVGRVQRLQRRAQGHDPRAHAVGAGQHHQFHRRAVGQGSERLAPRRRGIRGCCD